MEAEIKSCISLPLNIFAFQIAEEGTEADTERQVHSW